MRKCLFHSPRNIEDGLWDWNQNTAQNGNKTNFIISKNNPQMDLARYYYVTLFSLPISMLMKAIKNRNFESWPGIRN